MARLKARQGETQPKTQAKTQSKTQTSAPSRLSRVFDLPILNWQRLEADPLDAAYYVLLESGEEQVLWINQRAVEEPKIARVVAAMELLPGFTTTLIRADTSLTRLEYPYLITQYLPTPTVAEAWRDLDAHDKERAARAWGSGLTLLHRIRFDLAGDLAYPEEAGLRLTEDLEERWQKPLQLAHKDYMLDTPKLISALQYGQKLAADAPVTLCHGQPDARSFLLDKASGQVTAVLNLGDARRSDPLSDIAAILPELEALGCLEAFFQGYGVLSKWERERLDFYRLYHELGRYALSLTHFPNRLALSRLRLADMLASAPTH